MKLPFFSNAFVRRLREQADANVESYGSDTGWLDTFASGQQWLNENSQIFAPPPILLLPETGRPTQHDAENAKRIFTWLRDISPTLAMEERLWACLTHYVFPDYMAARWPVKSSSIIRRRYLFEGKSFASLTRNGISRLWWSAHLTHEPTRENPFELTETLFLRQDIQVSLLERAIGKCPVVRTAVLDFFRTNSDWISKNSFTKRIQVIIRELNLLGGATLLDVTPKLDIENLLTNIGEQLITEQ